MINIGITYFYQNIMMPFFKNLPYLCFFMENSALADLAYLQSQLYHKLAMFLSVCLIKI